ncbi:carbonic anhydrase family protein [Parasphingorhabdus halotolerans]|uniref:carbonic anhydrase n=2 Tax=Parasphingorhabdus halotolerans TaxID=2725558 RepID=A0A6H2DRC4_9SPHN|nr:carbonic anhydrase family protein [Parasphingorhabdus halotolerans]
MLAALIATGPALADHHSKAYDYGKNGPEQWGQLSDKYAVCESGDMQSPIDLAGANAKGNVALDINYSAGPLTVSNKGLTVQADFAAGSSMTSGGTTFNLIQIHFHTPSEHAISGKRFPLTGHFVHATEGGKLGVLGVMFEEGAANAELAKILAAAPATKSEPATVAGTMIDPNGMLPADKAVYRYMGSLTTPPCSEGVNWHVLRDPITASKSQIAAFEKLMGNNARPVRALNNRLVVAPE